jgi:hypothetical protein
VDDIFNSPKALLTELICEAGVLAREGQNATEVEKEAFNRLFKQVLDAWERDRNELADLKEELRG